MNKSCFTRNLLTFRRSSFSSFSRDLAFAKRWLTLVLVALFTTTTAWSQGEIVIGDEESTVTSSREPVNMFYHYSLVQQIYTADEIGMAGSISSISFYYTGTNAFSLEGMQVYMLNVDKGKFDSDTDMAPVGLGDKVWEGTFAADGEGWVTISLDTPFAYDGVNNLLVCFNDPTYGYAGSSCKFRTTSTASDFPGLYLTLCYYSDDQSIDLSNLASYSGHKLRESYRANFKMGITPSVGTIAVKPETLEASAVTTTTATISWTGSESKYNVQYKKEGDAEWTVAATGISAKTYNLTGLATNSVYQVRVRAINGSNASGWKSASFTTQAAIPLVEEFSTTRIPIGWSGYGGLLVDVMTGTALTKHDYVWGFYGGNHVFDNHARVNIYNTNCKQWLVTPTLQMEAGVELTFDLALTGTNGSVPPIQDTGTDDKFVVLITTDGGTTWTVLRQWDNAGSTYVFNNIANTAEGERVTIDLSSYAGQTIAIAFYAESTVKNADNCLHIDNVSIDYKESCPKPNLSVGSISAIGAVLTFSDGSGNYIVEYRRATDSSWTMLAFNTTQTTYNLSGLTPMTPYEVRVKSACSTDDWRTASFTTLAIVEEVGTDWSDNFEGSTCGWQLVNGSLENAWTWGSAVSHGGTHALYISNDGGTTHAYNNQSTKVMAAKLLHFNEGKYTFNYDWLCNGENNYDFLRAALVPAAQRLTAGTDYSSIGSSSLPSGWIALDGGSRLNQVSEWQQKSVTVNVAAGNYYLVFVWRNDNLDGNNPPAAIDNVIITSVSCPYEAENLTAGNVTATTAKVTWAGDGSAWNLQYKVSTADNWTEVSNLADDSYSLSGLTPTTTYQVRVQSVCGVGDVGVWSTTTFTTPPVAEEVGTSWSDNFEGSTCGWQLVNGDMENAWTWGTAVSHGGTHALYISNDGGTTNAYSYQKATKVMAAKLLHFSEGFYTFNYDWLCNGETSFDFLRVALVPASQELTYGMDFKTIDSPTLPEGWIALDGGSRLNLATSWQSKEVNVSVGEGTYYLVFAWRNDPTSGNNPPAAIDNVSISRLACGYTVANLAVSNVTASSATLSWTAGGATQWQVAYSTNSDFSAETQEIVSNPTCTVSGLTPETIYYVRVRSYCGDSDYGQWSDPVNFEYSTKPTIGSGTDTNYSLPSRTYYKYSVSQQIYTAAELGTKGTIQGIDFYNTSSQRTRNIDIYMVSTDKQGFVSNSDWVSVGETNLVFSGEVTYLENCWTSIPFDVPFIYDGVKNVVIVVDDNTGSYETGGDFRVFGASAQAICKFSDSENYDPANLSEVSGELCDFKNQIRLLKDAAPDVLKPTNLAVSCNGSRAVLTWSQPDDATQWLVSYKEFNINYYTELENPVNEPTCSLDLYTNSTYDVRVCAMKDGKTSNWSNPVRFTTDRYDEADLCMVNVTLTDAGGDGWDGSVMNVREGEDINGDIIHTITLESGSQETFTLKVPTTFSTTFEFVPAGKSYECGWIITDLNDDLINQWVGTTLTPLEGGQNPPDVVGTWMVNCTPSPVRIPTDLTVTEITTHSAKLSWTENCAPAADSWIVSYKRGGDVEYTEITTADNPLTLNNLVQGSNYHFKVRPNNSIEKWSDFYFFETLEENPTPTNMDVTDIRPTAATLSWTGTGDSYKVRYRVRGTMGAERVMFDFEDSWPKGWTVDGSGRCFVTGSANADYYGDAHSGTWQIRIRSSQNDTKTSLISPAWNLGGETERMLSFWYTNRKWYGDTDGLTVYYRVSGGDWMELWSTNEPHDTWTNQILYLKDDYAGEYQFKFTTTGCLGFGVGLDDIILADVEENKWNEVSTNTTSVNLTGLDRGSDYECMVRSLKAGNESKWSALANFTTKTTARGDANGDGTVSVTDIAVVVNHILSLGNAQFDAYGADANGDNQITVTDIGVIVDMILGTSGSGNAGSRRMQQQEQHEPQ